MMRRQDRAVVNPEEIGQILDKCKVLRLGLNDEGEVYIVPLNYGYTFEQGVLTFYLHGATQGRKLDILKQQCRVGFELDCDHALKTASGPCGHSFYYSSIIGNGNVTLVEELAEKAQALNRILAHQTGQTFTVPEKAAVLVSVYRLDVTEFSAKHHLPGM